MAIERWALICRPDHTKDCADVAPAAPRQSPVATCRMRVAGCHPRPMASRMPTSDGPGGSSSCQPTPRFRATCEPGANLRGPRSSEVKAPEWFTCSSFQRRLHPVLDSGVLQATIIQPDNRVHQVRTQAADSPCTIRLGPNHGNNTHRRPIHDDDATSRRYVENFETPIWRIRVRVNRRVSCKVTPTCPAMGHGYPDHTRITCYSHQLPPSRNNSCPSRSWLETPSHTSMAKVIGIMAAWALNSNGGTIGCLSTKGLL